MSDRSSLKRQVLELHFKGISKRQIAAQLGLPRSTVQDWIKNAPGVPQHRAQPTTSTIAAEIDTTPLSVRERQALTDKINNLQRELKNALRTDISAEKVREEIFKLSAYSPNPPDWTLTSAKKSEQNEMPIAIWSDWHIGEYVDPEQVNHVNHYTLDIAEQRVRKLVESTIHLCFDHRVNPKYKGIIINLAGDFITGDIHQELIETNEYSAIPAVLKTVDLLTWALTRMADKFGKVFCPCVFGNHGRATKKPQHKNAAYQNFDWLIYQILDRHFRNDPRITFYIPSQVDAQYEAYGIKFLLTHGDNLGTSGGDGIIGAIGPIMRGDSKTRNTNASMRQDYDVLLLGHYHQYLELPGATGFVNGSLIGYNEYAKNRRFKYQKPMQALFFVHPKNGITFRIPIHCEESPYAAEETVTIIK